MKKEGAVILLVILIGAAIFFLLQRKPVVAKDLTIGQIEWDASMPFAPNSNHSFVFGITNLTAEPHSYNVEVYWLGGFAGEVIVTLPPGQTWGYRSSMYMPSAGTYNLLAKLYIDDVYIDEFVVSEVEVK